MKRLLILLVLVGCKLKPPENPCLEPNDKDSVDVSVVFLDTNVGMENAKWVRIDTISDSAFCFHPKQITFRFK